MAQRDTELLLTLQRESPAYRPAYARLLGLPSVQKVSYLCADLIALALAHTITLHLIEHLLRKPGSVLNPYQYDRYYLPFFAAVLYLFEGYKSPELRRPEKEIELACKAVFASFIALTVLNFLIFRDQPFSRYLMVTWFGVSCLLLLVVRWIFRPLYTRLWKGGLVRRSAVLIGAASRFSGFRQLLSIQRYNGYHFLGLIPANERDNDVSGDLAGIPILGTLDGWQRIVESLEPDVVVMALPSSDENESLFRSILERSRELGIDLEVYSRAFATQELAFERDEFSGCLRFHSRPQWSTILQRFSKFTLDCVIGVIGSLVTLLLIPVIGLLIKLQDRGPIFYRSAYVGQDRSNRYYLKFRTMRVDADDILQRDTNLKSQFAARQKLEEDPRVTPLGRFLRKSSLDEFPQFFSVLSGQLSFVGPRTIRQEETPRYGAMLPRLLSVKPGMTGFWQVMGRQMTTYEERVNMDMFYIDRWSIWLDLVIIGKTFWKVIRAEGAY